MGFNARFVSDHSRDLFLRELEAVKKDGVFELCRPPAFGKVETCWLAFLK